MLHCCIGEWSGWTSLLSDTLGRKHAPPLLVGIANDKEVVDLCGVCDGIHFLVPHICLIRYGYLKCMCTSSFCYIWLLTYYFGILIEQEGGRCVGNQQGTPIHGRSYTLYMCCMLSIIVCTLAKSITIMALI